MSQIGSFPGNFPIDEGGAYPMALRTTPRQTADTNLVGIQTFYKETPPLSAADVATSAGDPAYNPDVSITTANAYLWFYTYRDTAIDELVYALKVDGGTGAAASVVYFPASNVDLDDSATDAVDTGISLVLTGGLVIENRTTAGQRTDGQAPVIPANSWVALEFSGTLTGLEKLVVSCRCRETNIL